MNKNAIKKFAPEARRELLIRVKQRAQKFGVTAENIGNPTDESVGGHLLSSTEKKQRAALIEQIKEKGYEQVMEEVAYTWFNRFSALRFMEVNGYLPTRVRVFTDENNAFKPQILTEAIHMELDGLDMEKVYAYKDANDNDELYKYLLITQCNALNSVLPGMFQKIADYTELLFPDNLLREGSVVQMMIDMIPEEDWKDAIQIIGWLYQYYISEPKDEKINARKQYKNSDIPFVTQLFTSDWIVRFIVENSLGRLWVENHPDESISGNWDYYIADKTNNIESTNIKPEEITCIDPCAGSGHIISYMFDVLVQIYESYGYTTRDAVKNIVQKNIHGLDIDDRAVQLAYFSIMMKAVQYDKRFLNRKVQPHIYTVRDSKDLSSFSIDYFTDGRADLIRNMKILTDTMKNASVYGSVVSVDDVDFELLYSRLDEIEEGNDLFGYETLSTIRPFIEAAELLSKKYSVVVTNPPYMATKYMPNELKEYISADYSDYKADLFSVFIVRCSKMCKKDGQLGFLTPYVWMFIQSYEKLRNYVYSHMTFSSLVQLEYNAFEAACVPVAAFTFRNHVADVNFDCIKLSDFKGVDNQAPKTIEAIANPECGYRYTANQSEFLKIPSAPVAYWVSPKLIDTFGQPQNVASISDFTGSQHITADNSKYLRLFWEIDNQDVGRGKKWAYYAKGGEYRKWYGNIQLVVDISSSAMEYYKTCSTANCLKEKYWFTEGITYSAITSSGTGFRYYPAVGGFDKGGATICYVQNLYYVLGVLNTNMAELMFQLMNPTINLQVKDVKAVPIVMDKNEDIVTQLVKDNIDISREDWDSYEVSYDFKKNPLIRNGVTRIEDAFQMWEKECENRFTQLKNNEETINRLINETYGVSGSVSSSVSADRVSVRKADRTRDIKNLISYAVGCMFGRYSLDAEGIVCAGVNAFDAANYSTFRADADNIIPICDDNYFDDDIVGLFVEFIKVVYGEKTLEENLRFIAETIGGKGQPRDIIRNYFVKSFYEDHCSNYAVTGLGKRPIYWQFDSGKKNGFKCLVYIHRYQKDTIARIRTDYIHEQQSRYQTEIEDIETRIDKGTTSEKVKLNKTLKLLKEKASELHLFEEKIHHLADQMIQLDINSGVVSNYQVLKDVLSKIK